ncbi:MAG TPA: bifunctional riboflavin kinase/FAD synthetase [Gemmatimonadota bacterium]|nr:bifunctional riboflavin kinase/FAD synthetase [Gemmatimonadota bacterium]
MSRTPYLPGRRRTTITVGTFDGFHRGHQEVLREIVRRARAADRASVLVTFEPHPLEIVAPDRAPRLLTTLEEKLELWPLFDLDYVHVLPFTTDLREMSPARFVREVLVDRLRVGELVIGYDHGFGKDRKGDVDTLRGLAGELGFVVDVVGPVAVDTEAVSSTAVRRAVETGDLEAAARGLGRPYSVLGRVARGAGRGRELGYPTANLEPGRRKCLPPTGVYAVRVEVEGVEWPAMANLGPRPTFGDARAGLEVHLLDWPGEELYGARLHVEFVERLRGVLRFGDPAELAAQLAEDRARARAALGRGPIRATGVA